MDDNELLNSERSLCYDNVGNVQCFGSRETVAFLALMGYLGSYNVCKPQHVTCPTCVSNINSLSRIALLTIRS